MRTTAAGTAGVPSTTATSLTSFGTGLPPGSHGLVGYTSRIPGTDKLLNALQWDKDVDPVEWQPHRPAFARLATPGRPVTVDQQAGVPRPGTDHRRPPWRGVVGADRVGERIAAAVAASSRAGPR